MNDNNGRFAEILYDMRESMYVLRTVDGAQVPQEDYCVSPHQYMPGTLDRCKQKALADMKQRAQAWLEGHPTNIERIVRLMETGIMVQVFVIAALEKCSAEVVKQGLGAVPANSIVAPQAWLDAANAVQQMLRDEIDG
jgi:hypothetical protein